MKILNISAQKPDSTGSGVYLSELVNSFGKIGIENAVICGIDKNDTLHFDQKTKVYPVYFHGENLPFSVVGMSDTMPYDSTRYKDLTAEMQSQFEKAFIQMAEKAVKEFQPDFILCHHLYFLTALIREHFPNVKIGAVCHGTDIRQFQKISLQNERIKENIQKLDTVFVLHQEQKDTVQKLFDLDEKKIFIIGVGYNNHIFHHKNRKKSQEEIQLIFAGKICEKKGVACLLKAMGRLQTDKKIKLVLAGGYSDEEEYQRILDLAKPFGNRVEFLGRLSQEELAEKYNESHIFILPSFFEGLPLVVIEALSCGLKVIMTNLPGVKGWIDANVKNSMISYVEPPKMNHVDEPNPEAEERFITELADCISCTVNTYHSFQTADTSDVSWDSVAGKICSRYRQL